MDNMINLVDVFHEIKESLTLEERDQAESLWCKSKHYKTYLMMGDTVNINGYIKIMKKIKFMKNQDRL